VFDQPETCETTNAPTDIVRKLESFQCVSPNDIIKVVAELKPKQSHLDPMPTWLLKMGANQFDAIISDIVNASFNQGVFPSDLKTAVITPGLKKFGLNQEEFKNYRPISNIPVLSKILEKCAAKQYVQHLSANNLNEC
jgi:hypothetical protein